MNPTASDTHPIEKAADEFGRNVIEAHAEQWNSNGTVPREFFQQAAEHNLCRLLVPHELGGAWLDVGGFTRVLTILARHCLASTFALVVHNNLTAAIARSGIERHIDSYLQAMMKGEKIGAFLLTEPGAGSDAAAISTTARRQGDDWILNGSKAWISNAVHADVLSVYVQTNESSGARGIAGFLLDAEMAGVSRVPPYDLLGGHALGTGGFQFNDCLVANGALLAAPGEAFKAAMHGINLARCGVAAMCVGLMQRALSEAINYTGQRTAFGAQLGDFQGVQWILADCATDLEAAQALTAIATRLIDSGGDATLAAAHAKKFATRTAFKCVTDCMQVMGAAGLSRSYPLARHLEAAKMAQYLDGATEIQNVVIARQLKAVYAD